MRIRRHKRKQKKKSAKKKLPHAREIFTDKAIYNLCYVQRWKLKKKKHKTQNKQTKKNTHKKNPQKQSKSKARKKFGRLYNVVCTYWSMAFFFISIVTGRQITGQISFEFEFNLPYVILWHRVIILNWEDKQYKISCLP